jgi:hypothetical protein
VRRLYESWVEYAGWLGRDALIGTEVLSRFEGAGYELALDGAELRASGPAAPTEELRALVEEHRDVLKAAILLSAPPSWLVRMLDLYAADHETEVRRTIPKGEGGQLRLDFGEAGEASRSAPYPENLRGGKAVKCRVRVSLKNICACVAAEIGLSPLEWECIRPEVDEAVA